MTARSWLRGLWLVAFVVGGVSGVRAQSTTGTLNDPAFGKITHTRNSTNFGSTATSFASRMIQLAVKIEF